VRRPIGLLGVVSIYAKRYFEALYALVDSTRGRKADSSFSPLRADWPDLGFLILAWRSRLAVVASAPYGGFPSTYRNAHRKKK
jgi:hypothetical protein